MTGGVLVLLGLAVALILAFQAAKHLEARYGERSFGAFVIRRMAWLALTVLVVFTITFFLMRAVPGGPFDEERRLLPEVKRNLLVRYGLDRPVHEQYVSALLGLLRFDFGPCLSQRDWSVRDVLLLGLPPSLLLGFTALFWALLIGLPAGFWAARKRGTLIDTILTALTSLGMAVPNFVLALLLLFPFSFRLNLLPPAVLTTPPDLLLPSLT
ncbi:MAG TPA: ABC transporter permease, partial [Planctomycetota bacterium]|nr:ABC transporter permease [Planctomycetota bacterium]